MKKIFGLFAAAALAATGLTCCGGGGGGNGSIAHKTFYFSALGAQTEAGTTIPGSGGSLWIEVKDEIAEAKNSYNARIGFGTKGSAGNATVFINSVDPEEADMSISFSALSYDDMQNDTEAVAYFSKAMEDVEFEDGEVNGVVSFPAMELKLKYSESSKSTGDYVADFPEAARIQLDINDPDNPDNDDDDDDGNNIRLNAGKAFGKFIIYG